MERGYLEDAFAREFCGSSGEKARRMPIINRGGCSFVILFFSSLSMAEEEAEVRVWCGL